jgi:hypothetical protein
MLSIDVAAGVLAGPFAAAGVQTVMTGISVIYEARRVSTVQVVADSEAISAITTSRRLVSRDPSYLRLLTLLVGLVGDVAAIFKLKALVRFLFASQLLLPFLAAGESTDIDLEGLLTSVTDAAGKAPPTAAP